MNSDLILIDWLKKREALQSAEHSFRHRQEWLQKREELELKIESLQHKIDQSFYQKYQTTQIQDKNTHLKSFEEERKQLLEWKRALIQIDRILDLSEDSTEDILHQQRFKLLQSLWEIFPQKKEEQEKNWKEWNHLKIIELELLGIDKLIESILEHLEIALKARQSIRGKGILNYIFGMSPNFIIERQLIEIQSLIKNSQHLFEKMLGQQTEHFLQSFLQKFVSWLEELKKSCSQSWSFRHIDTLYFETKSPLLQFRNQLETLREELQKKNLELEEEIHHWINDVQGG